MIAIMSKLLLKFSYRQQSVMQLVGILGQTKRIGYRIEDREYVPALDDSSSATYIQLVDEIVTDVSVEFISILCMHLLLCMYIVL